MTTTLEAQLDECREHWMHTDWYRANASLIPAVEENTRYLEAAPLRFGIEGRLLNNAIIAKNRGVDPIVSLPEQIIDDEGLSLHIFGAEDGHEYLRFDCFKHEPHYHYLVPGMGGLTRIDHDYVANGPMLPWTLGVLRSRLPILLRSAGALRLADELDEQRTGEVLDEIASTYL